MGATQVEINIHCPYCCKKETCEGFQEIENLIETGWVIYRHTDSTGNKSHVGEAGRSTSTNPNAFVLFNRQKQNMATADLFSQLDIQKIPCPRCRLKLEYAQKFVNGSPSVNRTDVISVCDHCLMQMKTEGPCHNCVNIINKFLAAHGEQEKYKNKYFRSWVTKTEHQIIESISDTKPAKTIQKRSYSEINIYLRSRDTSKTVIKCKIQELFHSEQNLPDAYHEKETKHPKNLGTGKTVNFTDLIEMFQKVSSDKDLKIKAARDTLYGQNELYDLKLHSSSSAEHIRSSIAKTLQYKDQTEQTIEEKEAYLKEHKISYKDKLKTESEKSFLFPQIQQTPDQKLKRYISSPELIQNIQEKLRLKAEKEQEKKEELERETKEQKVEKLIHKETSLKVDKQLHNDALTKTKLMDATSEVDKKVSLKSEPENVVKDSKHKDNKIVQRETLKKQETKDEIESSKELQSQTRLVNNKAAEFDEEKLKEKLLKSKTDHQKEKKIEIAQMKELPHSKINENLGKYKRIENTKEKETPIHAEEVNVSELKKRKDQDNIDKRKRSENIEVKEIPVGDKDIVKKLNKHEDLKEKQPLISGAKQLAHKKEEDKLKKGENLKENEFPISDIKHLAKVKKMETENEKYASKTKTPEETDVITDLARNREKASKEAARFEKNGGDIPSKEIYKLSKGKPDKVGELKEVKGHEKMRDSLHPTETGKSEKANNLEDSKPNDVKLNQVKLVKPSKGDLVTQLIKVNNKALAKDFITTKVPELPIVEDLKEAKGFAKKHVTLQPTQIGKSEKVNNVEDSKQNDIKLNLVKLVKPSTGDLITQLVKVNNKVVEKDSIKPKLPDLSKIIVETTKTKEKSAEKLKSAPETKPKDNTVDLPRKDKQEIEIPKNQVKLVESNFDSLILRLIKIRPTAERSVKPLKKDADKIKKMHRFRGTKMETEEDQESSEVFGLREEPISIRRDGELASISPPRREGQEIKPIYVRLKLSDISSLGTPAAVEGGQVETENGKNVDPEAGKGVIRYALSDRTFIEKGWTMLPVEKVVRKMNIYRMRPAQPEFDWFEHNKKKGLMVYDTGAKLAEFDDNGRGRWFYKNGCLALDYYEAEETNTQQRFVVYSNGEVDERGRSHPITILATFDHLGNGVVFDHSGKIRLKYNQTEGVLLDRSVGPVTNWKWHSLNDPPVLQQVMIDTQMPLKDPNILKMGGPADNRTRPDNEEMLAIEFDNFIKEKSKKLTQKFKPFQIKMKALKINDHFSLKVLDQATIYLIFRDGSANLKLNIGMVLDHKEIVDTDTAELGEVSNSMERFPARTDSLAALQRSVAYARRYERMRTERECKLRHPESCLSVDNLGKAASRPLRPPLRTLPTSPTGITSPVEASTAYCKCSRKPSSTLYYNTQLL